MFIANPFWILFGIYFFANAYSLMVALTGAPLGVDSQQYVFELEDVFLTSLALFFSFCFVLFIYYFSYQSARVKSVFSLGNRVGLFVLIIQLAYFIYSYMYGVNIAGVEDSVEGMVLLRILFSIIQPEIIYLIAAPGLRSRWWFVINSAVYIVSSLMRGWMGGLFLIAIIFLIKKYPFEISWKRFFYVCGVIFVGVLIFPILVSVKWSIRSGEGFDNALIYLREVGYFNYMFESFGYLINRFQMFGHVALLSENSNFLFESYSADKFIPYWMDGLPQWIWLKFSGVEIFQLNRYMVSEFFGSDNLAYSTNPGIAGWFFVLKEKSLVFLIYLLAITVIPAIFILKFAGEKYFLYLMCFSFVYLFHGWIGAYFNMMIYLVLFVGFRKIFLQSFIK
ncbi:MAG: oligosaccharide repeat unit polymerase [Comamonas sp.]|uniref:oligosaccharide repeat unit polymerase n=1 Tax=Comamonas sp. TaxID=34028 RepID=UPI002FCC1C9B